MADNAKGKNRPTAKELAEALREHGLIWAATFSRHSAIDLTLFELRKKPLTPVADAKQERTT